MYMYMYIHTHIVCFEGKKYVLRGKKRPKIFPQPCAVWQRVRAHVHARTHARVQRGRARGRERRGERVSGEVERGRERGRGRDVQTRSLSQMCARTRACEQTHHGGRWFRARAGRTHGSSRLWSTHLARTRKGEALPLGARCRKPPQPCQKVQRWRWQRPIAHQFRRAGQPMRVSETTSRAVRTQHPPAPTSLYRLQISQQQLAAV